MRRFIVGALIASATLMAPAAASAKVHHGSELDRQYERAYREVVRRHGLHAAGRNIVRQGRRPGKDLSVRASLATLRRLLYVPPPVPAAAPVASVAPTATTSPAPQYEATTTVATASSTASTSSGTLASIRACESGGNYSTNTGNGFYGAYQFTDETWHAVGGSGHASDASPAEQDQRAAALYAGGSGAGNWPVCSHR